ncbi:hypothetical protein DFH06DRAFT_1131914 [Mycena polygramma]|nr:hypothetical protein DFH06DRAFT_1131914 [Mycena polygramma]
MSARVEGTVGTSQIKSNSDANQTATTSRWRIILSFLASPMSHRNIAKFSIMVGTNLPRPISYREEARRRLPSASPKPTIKMAHISSHAKKEKLGKKGRSARSALQDATNGTVDTRASGRTQLRKQFASKPQLPDAPRLSSAAEPVSDSSSTDAAVNVFGIAQQRSRPVARAVPAPEISKRTVAPAVFAPGSNALPLLAHAVLLVSPPLFPPSAHCNTYCGSTSTRATLVDSFSQDTRSHTLAASASRPCAGRSGCGKGAPTGGYSSETAARPGGQNEGSKECDDEVSEQKVKRRGDARSVWTASGSASAGTGSLCQSMTAGERVQVEYAQRPCRIRVENFASIGLLKRGQAWALFRGHSSFECAVNRRSKKGLKN